MKTQSAVEALIIQKEAELNSLVQQYNMLGANINKVQGEIGALRFMLEPSKPEVLPDPPVS